MWLGLGVAVLAFLADRVSKWLLIELMADGPLRLTGFLNLVMTWNTGVSFGLLRSDGALGRWLLIAVALAILAGVLYWLTRTRRRRPAAGLGLIAGGALGNVADRLLWGAVADFFDFHLGDLHWPAFNVADSAIVVGVAVLVLDGLFGSEETTRRGS